MKLKELTNKYKEYDVEVFGKPLNTPTIPYTFLPKDKDINECEVVEFRIKEKEHTNYGIRFSDMKPIKPEHKKGYVQVYIK